MTTKIVRIPTQDGFRLAATWYRPTAHPLGITVLVSSATGVPQRYYRHFATWLAAQGVSAWTYDYRGIGLSGCGDISPERMRMRDWGQQDFTAMVRSLRDQAPENVLVHVGHSIGGQVPGLSEACGEVDMYAAIASQFGYFGLWPWQQRMALLPIWYGVVPAAVHTMGSLPGAVFGGETLPAGIALEWARWSRNPQSYVDENGRRLPRYFTQIGVPARFYAFTDDERYAPLRAVRELAMQFRHAQIEIVSRAPADYGRRSIGHFGYFRKGMDDIAWPELFAWLLARAERRQDRRVA